MNVHLLTIQDFSLAQVRCSILGVYKSAQENLQVIPLSCAAYRAELSHKALIVRKADFGDGLGVYEVLACTDVRAMGLFSSNGNGDVIFDASKVEATIYIRL
jgi:hypothetical protein